MALEKFYKGEIVVCILNNRASLTVGKEYTILDVEDYQDEDFWITVRNDYDSIVSYHYTRFIAKSDFRKYKINDILKD
jgi:hypothetical protein